MSQQMKRNARGLAVYGLLALLALAPLITLSGEWTGMSGTEEVGATATNMTKSTYHYQIRSTTDAAYTKLLDCASKRYATVQIFGATTANDEGSPYYAFSGSAGDEVEFRILGSVWPSSVTRTMTPINALAEGRVLPNWNGSTYSESLTGASSVSISGATDITQWGIYRYAISGLNYLSVSCNSNTATQEIVIKLHD